MQLVLERVLGPRVPGRRPVRLGPEVPLRVGASELEADQVVHLVFAAPMMPDPVVPIHGSLHLGGHIADLTTVSGGADILRGHGERRTRSERWVRLERRAIAHAVETDLRLDTIT